VLVLIAGGDTTAIASPFESSAKTGASTLLLWPAGPPEFGALPGGGPGTTVIVDEPGSGRHSIGRIPGIAPGDFPVPLLPVGRQLVYNANRGVSAIPDSLHRAPRVLGRATFFVPAATTDQVWLVDQRISTGVPGSVRAVSVSSGRAGPILRLPPGTAGVVEGTRAGLLLVARTGWLELWQPGGSLRRLGRLGGSLEGAGVAADARLVVYTSGCRNESATSGFPSLPVGYQACATLNVVDVVTDARLSVPAPAGTLGWVPRGFGPELAIAPGDHLLAAEAAVAPAAKGKVRVFVLRLGRIATVMPVPSSIARLYAGTAWSLDGSRLFYQGPGQHLHALEVATGATQAFRLRCCQYAAMVVVPSGSS
jgi:hypothetical protein